MSEEKLDLLLQHSIFLMEEMKGLKTDVAGLKADVAELKADVAELKADVAELKADAVELKVDVAMLKADVAELKADVAEIKQRLESVELILENETNTNIQIIAEGHLDLFRKLDESLKVSHESEIYQIKVNRLESEIRRIKDFYKSQSMNQRAAAN